MIVLSMVEEMVELMVELMVVEWGLAKARRSRRQKH